MTGDGSVMAVDETLEGAKGGEVMAVLASDPGVICGNDSECSVFASDCADGRRAPCKTSASKPCNSVF